MQSHECKCGCGIFYSSEVGGWRRGDVALGGDSVAKNGGMRDRDGVVGRWVVVDAGDLISMLDRCRWRFSRIDCGDDGLVSSG